LGSKRSNGGAFGDYLDELFEAIRESYDARQPIEDKGWLSQRLLEFRSKADGDVVAELFGSLPREMAYLMLDEDGEILYVESTALPEPFKVRIISRGPTVPYWRATVIQKLVHKALQLLPEFRLTRETPDRDAAAIISRSVGGYEAAFRSLYGRVHRTHAVDDSSRLYVSGDYKGATDNLNPHVSREVCEQLAAAIGLNEERRSLFVRSLVGHVLYTDVKGVPDGRKQEWGQLMGSPTSFPVLCVANWAMSAAALEEVEWRGMRVAGKSGIVVNGDDITFRAWLRSVAQWKKRTAECGLAPSVGKNFIAADFLQVNSKMFITYDVLGDARLAAEDLVRQTLSDGELAFGHLPVGFDRPPPDVEFHCLPNASLAVLAPPRRVEFAEFCLSAPSWQRTFLSSFTGDHRDALNTTWLSVWRHFLDRLPSGLMNWSVPRTLGGFGLEPTRPVTMNEAQRRVAAYYRDNTDPESSRRGRLVWEQPLAATTTHVDAQKPVKGLMRAGLLVWRWCEQGETPLDTSPLEQLSALSGWSVPVDRDGVQLRPRILPFWAARPGDSLLGSSRRGRTLAAVRDGEGLGLDDQGEDRFEVHPDERSGDSTASKEESVEDLPPRRAAEKEDRDERYEWLRRSTSRLRKAAKSSSRSMNEDQVLLYRPREAGYFPAPSYTLQAADGSTLKTIVVNGLPVQPRVVIRRFVRTFTASEDTVFSEVRGVSGFVSYVRGAVQAGAVALCDGPFTLVVRPPQGPLLFEQPLALMER
jgi:hypothetical protein